jgi:hypothetical protein
MGTLAVYVVQGLLPVQVTMQHVAQGAAVLQTSSAINQQSTK